MLHVLALVLAQTALSDSFEGDGGLTTLYDVDPQMDLAITTDFSVTGTHALRLTHHANGNGVGNSDNLSAELPSLTGTVTVSGWVRMESTNGEYGDYPLQVHGLGNPNGTNAELLLTGTGMLNVGLNTQGRSGFHRCPTTVAVTPGEWHLLELITFGNGTDAGVAQGFVDGQPVCTDGNDWSEYPMSTVFVGAGAYLRQWDGTVWIDEVRVTQGVAADRVEGAAVPGPAGTCSTLAVIQAGAGIADSFAPVELFWRIDGGVQVVEDDCVTPRAAPWTIGQSQTTRLRLLAPGPASIELIAPGLLGASLNLVVTPGDGGTPDAGAADAGAADAGADDAGADDAGAGDAGAADAGGASSDAGAGDAGATGEDAGLPPADAGDGDAGLLPRYAQVGCGCTSFETLGAMALLALFRRHRAGHRR